MNVKVHCPCGTRFAFDVEPVHGRMPMAINCPGCGADATELANAVIQSQPAPAAAPRAKIVATVVAHSAPTAPAAPAPASAPSTAIRIARSAPTPAESAQAQPGATGRKCPRHPAQFAKEVCLVCGKPICPKCMEITGYVCSVYCREQAEHKHIEVPEYAGKKVFTEYRSNRKLGRVVMGVGALVFLVLGVWAWYAWFARSPKVIYSVEVVPPHYLDAYRVPDYYRLLGPNQLLVVKDKSVTLMEPQGQKQLWTTQLRTEAEIKAATAAHAKNDDLRRRAPRVQDEFGNTVMKVEGLDPLEAIDDHLFDDPRAIASSNEVWVAFARRIVRLDRQTGSFKDVPAVPDTIARIRPTQEMMLVTSYSDAGRESLTRILLPEGTVETEVITTNRFAALTSKPAAKPGAKPTAPAATKPVAAMSTTKPAETPQRGTRGARATSPTNTTGRARGVVPQATPAPAMAKKSADDDGVDSDFGDIFDYGGHPYIIAGQDVIEFKTKLKERRTVSHEAMKTPPPAPGKSVLDDKSVTASRGVDLAREMANESRRAMTGGLDVEDVSLYEVTIHRHFAKDEADWTGEVIGPPEFTPLKTVDIVAGYSNIVVLDKSHKKLWEAKLTFPVVSRYSWENEGKALPCLETKDALYYADKGVLTRFDSTTGNVRWRLPSVGVSDIQADAQGNLYVDTTDANPESIKYSQELDLERETKLAIIKVNAADGKVKWRYEFGGNRFHFLPPGRFVFSERTWTVLDPMRLEEGPIAHYNMKLHNPNSGSVIWIYPQTKHQLIRSEVVDNWIMLDFDDQLMVLKFFSL